MLSTTMKSLYLSVTPLFRAVMESSMFFITSFTPLGLASFRVVFLISSFMIASLAMSIQSTSRDCVHAMATCP